MINKAKHFVGLLSLVVFLWLILITQAAGLAVGPDKYFADLSVGELKLEKLSLYGKADATASHKYYLTPVNMKKVGETNDREFTIPPKTDMSQPANWITLEKTELTLDPAETEIVNWVLEPSAEAACGTSLAAIIISDAPLVADSANGQAKVDFDKQIAVQVHVNIQGTNTARCQVGLPELNLLEFKVINEPLFGLFAWPLFNYDQVPLLTRLQNPSSYIARNPQGFIKITGFNAAESIPFNAEKLDIYPNTVRRFDNLWQDEKYPHNGNLWEQFQYEITHLRFGLYTAQLGISKNVNPTIVAETSFWVVPWKIVLLTIIVIFSILWYLRSKKYSQK